MSENDQKNMDFWDEPCGTTGFKALGLDEINIGSIEKFDRWYLDTIYPYLRRYIPTAGLEDKQVLEIGLGFGTVGQQLFLAAGRYTGLDIAETPVEMMNQRILWHDKSGSARATQGNALDLDFEDNRFDLVVSIGCLHHTGNTPKAITEVYRVLKPGGKAVVMLYNKNSLRKKVLLPLRHKLRLLLKRKRSGNYDEFVRSAYDASTSGQAAPITEFYSCSEVAEMFKPFQSVKTSVENFDEISLLNINFHIHANLQIQSRSVSMSRGGVLRPVLPRKLFLNNIARVAGLDLYTTAIK